MQYIEKAEAHIKREKKGVVVDRELERIYAERGTLTPEAILESARDEGHALHRYFEWDDSVAAEKYRRAQASSLILASKFVAVLNEADTLPHVVAAALTQVVRKFLPESRAEGFRMRKEIIDDAELRRQLIDRKVSVLRSWLRETVDIPELADLRRVIGRGIEKVAS